MKRIINKFKYALTGIIERIKNDRSVCLQIIIAILAIIVSLVLKFSLIELMMVITLCGLVICLELVNSAIEEIVNCMYPEYNQNAKRIKDICAGAVMIAALTAFVVGIMILVNHL